MIEVQLRKIREDAVQGHIVLRHAPWLYLHPGDAQSPSLASRTVPKHIKSRSECPFLNVHRKPHGDSTDFDSLEQVSASGEAAHEKEGINALVDLLHLSLYEF